MAERFLLTWDLPSGLVNERKQVNRMLHSAGAVMVQHSFWRHDDFKKLVEAALLIKGFGGKARILEERFLF